MGKKKYFVAVTCTEFAIWLMFTGDCSNSITEGNENVKMSLLEAAADAVKNSKEEVGERIRSGGKSIGLKGMV